jgi:hypothetical protein
MGEASRPGVLVAQGTSSVPLASCAPLAPLVKAGRWLIAWASAIQIYSRKQVTLIIGVFSLIAVVDWELPNKASRTMLLYLT